MSRWKSRATARLAKWLEPELFQPFVFGVLISLSLSEFVRGALTLSMLPTYGRTVLGFAVEWTALALSIHYLVDNVLRSPVGWIIDRLGQRWVLITGFVIAAAAVGLMMTARSIASLLASLALYGVGVTPMWPAALSGISQATPDRKRASFMGYMYIFWLTGTGLGPVLINFVIGGTYRAAFLLLLVVLAIAFGLAYLLVRDPDPTTASEVRTQRRLHMNKAYWQALWTNVREVAFLFPGMFAQTFAVASLIPVLSLYATLVLHVSGAVYSSILVFGGAFTAGLLIPAGRLVDRFGPRRFLVVAFLSVGVVLGLYPLYHTLLVTYVVVALFGVAYAFILPAWNTVLDRSIDPDKKATLWGVFMTVEGLGSAMGPYLGGLVWDRVSPEAPFVVSAAVIFIMGLLYVKLPIDRDRNHRTQDTRVPTRAIGRRQKV